jgi:5-oxoprolinase (ATP-hydrolysing)
VQCEATGKAADLVEREHPVAERPEADIETALIAPVFLHGAWTETRFVRREALRPGDTLTGPAVVVEPHTSILVEPGWRARITAHDHVELTRLQPRPRTERTGR